MYERLLSYPRPDRLQATLDVLTGLFDRVGLCSNFNKIFGIVCQTFLISSKHLEEVYQVRVKGVGPSFQERQE